MLKPKFEAYNRYEDTYYLYDSEKNSKIYDIIC